MTAIARNRILVGDVLDMLASLPDGCVHCVVTSPPYWGLRDYGVAGQIGLEPTAQGYLDRMVAVFREVRRVLRADGSCWMNMGDSYAASATSAHARGKAGGPENPPRQKPRDGLKPKDLVGMPWRLALALQADGWWLRSDIIWAKPNPMPSSVTDRPGVAHEYLFLLTKSARYFYDAEAVREPSKSMAPQSSAALAWSRSGIEADRPGQGFGQHRPNRTPRQNDNRGGNQGSGGIPFVSGRNLRSVWTIPVSGFPDAHFATFPPALVEPCIKAGSHHRDAIERQLAHGERNTVRAAYNFAEYLPERRKMMQAWADYLDALKAGAKVTPLHRGQLAEA